MACCMLSSLVMSAASGRKSLLAVPAAASSSLRFLEVAATAYPFFNNVFTRLSPNPLEAPVTNHTFFFMIIILEGVFYILF